MSDTTSKWKSFSTYDRIHDHGWSEALISNLERILHAMRESPPVYNMISFYDELNTHLAATNPHDFRITQYSEEIIDQLYGIYRRLGYDGSIADMLERILKNITIADVDTILNSATRYEAVNVIGWKLLTDTHKANAHAHHKLFHVFRLDDQMFYPESSWSFSSTFKELWNPFAVQGYTLDGWNTYEGTLFTEIVVNNIPDEMVLFTIYFQSHVWVFSIRIINNRQCLVVANTGTDIVIAPLSTIEQSPCIERLIFSYDKQTGRGHWRTLTQNGTFAIDLSPAVYLTMTAPLAEHCSSTANAVIRLLTYYPRKIEPEQTLILL